MTKDVIEYYDTIKTKGCPADLIFSEFNDQPIPSNYYNIPNNDNVNGNNIPCTPVDNALPENKGVQDTVFTNVEDINDEIRIYDDDSLASGIYPLQKNWKLKEWTTKTK